MISRFGSFLNRIASRIVPDPFVLAVGLTLVVMALAAWRMSLGEPPPNGISWTLIKAWAGGFGDTGGLAFALQMSLVLVTGHALALSPPVQRMISVVARIPKSAASASMLVAFVTCLSAIVHWGLGAIVGAFLAREMARNSARGGLKLHYPILGAAAYSGLAVWHGGLSGSAPLKVAETGHFVQHLAGVIPLTDTIFSPLNLIITATLVLAIGLLFYAMTPRKESELVAPPLFIPAGVAEERQRTPGLIGFLHESPIPGFVLGGMGVIFVASAVVTARIPFDLNSVILFFLFLGLLFQGGLMRYMNAVTDGASGAGAILIQFPFYFGIVGLMKAGGLIEWISVAVISLSTFDTFPVVAFYLACLVNMFVPSGGGQWAVQAHILLEVGNQLGVPPAKTVMAFAYGDACTNMLQPFWALPLLGIMKLQAKDIIGYSAMVCLLMMAIVTVLLLVL